MKKNFLLLVFLSLFLVQRFFATETINLDDFSYTEDQVGLAQEVITILEEDHFLKKSFASIQNEAFDLYLERLDPNKNIFLSSELAKYKEALNNKNDIKDNLKRVSKQTGQSINTILSNSTKSIIKTKLGVISCLKK